MRKRIQLTDIEFVTAWLKAGNYADLVSSVGLSKAGIQARASRLRKAGVKLPKYGRMSAPIDVKGLNELIVKHKKSQ